jgi:hypothetical protein
LFYGKSEWIADTIADYKTQMEPIAKVRFKRLKEYYPRTLLERIQRVIVDRCPVPPLASTGIPQLGVPKKSSGGDGIPPSSPIRNRRKTL